MIIPVLLSLGTLSLLYNARGPSTDLAAGRSYAVGLPRASLFPGKSDAEIRTEVSSRSVRGSTIRRITSDTVWLKVPFAGDQPGGFTEQQLLDYWRSVGAKGPFPLYFGSF